jgi:hypothetical protein
VNRRKIIVGESYHARKPVNLRRYGDYAAWQVTVLSKEALLNNSNGKPVIGIEVVDDDGNRVVVASRDVLSTWADYQAEKSAREQSSQDYARWLQKREQEIADSHLTLCAHLQSQGLDIPQELTRPQDRYQLTAAEILQLTGADVGQIARSQVRSRHLPKEEQLPQPVSDAQYMKRMVLLQAVSDELARMRNLNEDAPDLSSLLGADEPVLGMVLEVARTASIVASCRTRYKMSESTVRKGLTELARAGFIYTFADGWKLSTSGKASLQEYQQVTS